MDLPLDVPSAHKAEERPRGDAGKDIDGLFRPTECRANNAASNDLARGRDEELPSAISAGAGRGIRPPPPRSRTLRLAHTEARAL